MRDTSYKDELTSDSVDVFLVRECERLGEWEYLGEWASGCVLQGTHLLKHTVTNASTNAYIVGSRKYI